MKFLFPVAYIACNVSYLCINSCPAGVFLFCVHVFLICLPFTVSKRCMYKSEFLGSGVSSKLWQRFFGLMMIVVSMRLGGSSVIYQM